MAPDEKSLNVGDGYGERLTREQRALWNRTFPNGIDRSRFTQDQLELWDALRPEGVSTAPSERDEGQGVSYERTFLPCRIPRALAARCQVHGQDGAGRGSSLAAARVAGAGGRPSRVLLRGPRDRRYAVRGDQARGKAALSAP